MMLVVVIGFFLTTEIPLLVITVLHTLDNRSVSVGNIGKLKDLSVKYPLEFREPPVIGLYGPLMDKLKFHDYLFLNFKTFTEHF